MQAAYLLLATAVLPVLATGTRPVGRHFEPRGDHGIGSEPDPGLAYVALRGCRHDGDAISPMTVPVEPALDVGPEVPGQVVGGEGSRDRVQAVDGHPGQHPFEQVLFALVG